MENLGIHKERIEIKVMSEEIEQYMVDMELPIKLYV